MDPMTMMMIASAASSMLNNSSSEKNNNQSNNSSNNPFQQKQIPQLTPMTAPSGYLELLKKMSRGG